ncbi:alkaline-phosphatase-like protein [Geopyxis carbonaria]|nr:alkaline-phosphatase-like protein [Geopyxis carbonaria]
MGWFTKKFSWPPDRSYFYSLLVTSLLTSKFLHLFSHLPAVPIFLFLLYLPTFLFPDLFVILITRAIFHRYRTVGVILCCVITSASAAQIGFFIETGGEIRWNMMAKVMREPEGFFGMLMSGFAGLAATTGILAGIAWLLNPIPYNVSGKALKALFATILPNRRLFESSSDEYTRLNEFELQDSSEDDLDEEPEKVSAFITPAWKLRLARIKLAAAFVVITILHIVRPRSPYGHMSGTLPFTLFDGMFARRSAFCDPQPWDGPRHFPLQNLIKKNNWLPPAQDGGIGRGWRPGTPWWEVKREMPEWLPEKPVDGFAKYYRKPPPPPPHGHGHGHGPPPDGPPPPPPEFDKKFRGRRDQNDDDDGPPPPGPPRGPPRPRGYDSVIDPLKISNLDQPLLEQIQKAINDAGTKIPIKHVVLLSLESTRKDVFPLVKNGTLESQLTESRRENTKAKRDDDNLATLSELSRTAESVTGEDTGFGRGVNSSMGGLNIHGALTGSTFTLKSLLGSHCGVSPLPVDFLEELETEIYQPCLPQILKVMNMLNDTSIEESDEEAWPWKKAQWKSAFMQAATNKFDREAAFLEQLGFDKTVVREDLQDPKAKFPPKGLELNYFGYSETELKPYLRELFEDAEKNNERVFLSHLTSSTHHPWATPEEFGEQQRYWGGSRGGGTPWDHYLNAIKWGDQWIGEFLNLLEELGVADKTLVVMIGDHGFSFGDDSAAKTTYANAHINSFRVPLVFRHPALPNIQINATVTSMSILPTILDLLRTTSSLSPQRASVATDLLPEYEGQSLIRTFLPSRDGRQAWNLGVVNPGGTHLSLVSSSTPFRLVMPICEPSPFTFSNLKTDPNEAEMVEDWEGGIKLRLKVKTRYGDDAARWVREAERVGEWLVWELRRRWDYWDGSRREDRGPGHNDDGLLEHDHWWDT